MGIYYGRQLAFAGAAQQHKAPATGRQCKIPSWFRGIPPERVGLDGKYDHYGLQKRVEAAFRELFEPADLAQLTIGQRGRVVILQGRVESREMLRYLVSIAERVEGTIRVEVVWVVIADEAALLTQNLPHKNLA